MNYRFLDVDMSAVTFHGLSRSLHRKVALISTLMILAGILYFSMMTIHHLGDAQLMEQIALIVLVGSLVNVIIGGEFVLLSAAKKLFDLTPLGILYRQDRSIIGKAKCELLSLADTVEFRDYLDYGKINPAVRSKGHLLVMAHQRKGDLRDWVRNAKNLKHLANLVFQIHLVEQVLLADSVDTGVKGQSPVTL